MNPNNVWIRFLYPTALSVLVILLTLQSFISYERFDQILLNQKKILLNYEEITAVVEERIKQNDETKRTLAQLVEDDKSFLNECVKLLDQHYNEKAPSK